MSNLSDYLSLPPNESSITNLDVVSTAPNIPFPTTESQAKGSSNDNLSLDNYLNSPATLETRMAPTPFDWNKSQADRFVQNNHYATEGFNPYADNELKYAGVQTWGDVMSNAVGGSWSLAKNTFVEGWRGWSNLGSALFNWSTDQTFMERLAGSPEELMQRDEEQKDILNKYAIYKSPVKDTGFGIFNREFIGDMIQQGGFSLGAGAQFLSEMALTWGIGEGFGAIAKSAGWLAKGVKGAENVKDALNVAEKARQVGSTADVINAARKATDPTALKSFAKNFREYSVKAGSWAGDQFNVFGGIDKAVKAYEAGASTYQLASMGVGGITRAFAALNTATTEARFEAASTYGGMYASLMDEWQQKHSGELPQGKDLERIQKTAYASATDVFGANTALLMAFNQIQYGNIMSKFGSSSRLMREALEKGEGELFTVTGRLKNAVVGATEAETIKEGTKASRAYLKGTFGALSNFNEIRRDFGLGTALYQVGKRVGKFETSEGLQEILQSTTDTTFRDYYTNLYHGGKDIEGNSFIKDITSADWGKGLQSQLNMEGWQTFMMGAVTGLFMNPLQAGVMQGFKKANAGVNAQYKGEADAHKKMMQDSKTILNTWYNDPKKSLSEHISGLKVQGKADQNMMDAVYNGDKYEFHNAKDDAFTNALEVAIKTGNYKSFVDSIKELGERLTDEEFAKAFSLDAEGEGKVSARGYTQSIVKEIESYYDNRERLMNEFGHLVQPELYAHDGEMYKSALFAKKSLDEAIGLLATTSYHATRTIERATEIRAEAAALPTIGISANKVFEILGNIATAEMELGRLEEELETYKGLESDKTVATKIANTKEQIKHLQDWIMNYHILESHKKGERGKTTPFVGGYPTMYKTMQAMIDSHTGYLTAINNEYSKVTGVPDRREMMKSFNLLMDYNKLNRDNAHYVSALNVLSDPRGFNMLFDKISNALYTNSAKLRAEHLEESRKRISAITGVDPEDINTEDEEETKRTAENIRQEKTLSSLLKKTEQEITDLLNRSTENEKEVNASIESIKQIQNQIAAQQNILSTLSDQKDLIKETKKVIKSLKKELVTLNKTVKDLQKEKVNISKTLERLEYLKDSYSAAILQLQESTVTFQEINKIEKGLLNRLRKEQLVAPGVELTQMINDLQQQLDAIDSNITAHYAIIATTQKLIDELTFFVTQSAEGITGEQLSTYRENLEFTKKKLKDTALAIDALIQDRDSVARKLYNGELALEQRENIEKLKGHMKYVKIVTDALEEAGVKNQAFQTPEGSTLSPEEKQVKGESQEDEILNEIIAFYSTPKKPSAPPTPPAPAAPAAGGSAVVANPPVIVRTDEGKVDLQKMMDEVLATGTLVSYNPLELKGETQDLIEQIEAVADETNVLAKIVKTKATGTPVTPATETPVEPTSTLSAEAEEYLNNNPDLKSKLEATKAGLEDNTKTEKQAAKEVEDAINTVKTAPKAKVGPDEMLSFPDLPGNPAVQKITDEIFRVPVINKYQSYSTVEEANAALREWVKKNYPTAKEMTPAERKIFTARKNALAKFRKQFNAKSFFANPDLQDLSNDDFTYIFDNTSSYEHFVRSMFVTKDEKLRNASDYYGYDERTDKTYLDKWQDLITEEEYNQALAAYVSGLNKIDEVYDKKVVDLNTSLTPEEKQRELIRMEGDRLKRNIRYFPEKLFYNHITGRTSILGNVYVMMRTTNYFNVATQQQAIDSIDKYIGEKLAKLEGVNIPEVDVTEQEPTATTGEPVSDIKEEEETGTTEEPEIVTGTEPDPTAISTEIVERLEMIGLKLSNEEMALIPYLAGTKKITAQDNVNIKDLNTFAKRIADSLSEMIGLEHPVGDTGYVFNNKDQGSEFAVTELFLNGRYDKVLNGETEGEENEDMFEPEDSEVNNVVPTPRVYSTTQITLVPFIDFDALWKDDELWNDGGKSPEQRQEENKKNEKVKVPSAIYSLYDKKSKRERSKLFLELSQDNIYDRVKIEFTATPGKTYPYNLYFYVDDQVVGWVNTLNNTEQPGIDLINILKAKLQKVGTSQIVVTGTELEEIVKFTVGKGSLDLVERNPDGSYQKGIPFNQVLFNSESETGDPIVQRITETGEDFVSGSSDDVPSDAEDQSLYTGAYRALIKFPNGNSYWIQLSHRQLTPAEVDNTIRQINEQAAKAYSGTITNNEIKAINKQLANIFPTINVFEENADKKGLKIYLTLDPGNKAAGISGGRKLTVAVQYQMGATKKVEFAEIKQPSGGAVSFTDVNDLLARINNAVNTINQRKTLPEVPPVTEKSLKEQIPLENSLPYIMRMTTNVTTPNVVGIINFGINVVSNFPGLNDQANTVARDVKEDKTAKGGGAVVEPNTPTAQEKINPNTTPPATDIDSMPTSTEDEYNKYLDALEKEDEANKNAKKANKILKGSPVFSAKSVENIETFSKWVKDKLPQDVISIEEIDTLIANLQDNNITVGEFIAKLDKLRQIKGVIKVAKESPFKYHEAFHAVFRLLLTQDQINGLLAEARKEFPITEEGLEELRTLTPENQKLTRKQLEELYLEEKMADRFDTYMMNKKAPVSSGIKAFFQKLLRFIQNFFKRFTPSDIETLFADIDAGKYKNSTIQDNSYTNDIRTNPLGFTLPACKVIKLGTDEVILPNGKKVFVDVYMSQKQADKLVATITAQFDQEVRNKNLKEYNSENILNNILDVYKATYNPRKSKYFDVQSKITNPAEAKAYTKRVFNMHNIFSQKETRNAIKESVAASLRVLGYEVTLDALENDKITDTYGPRSSDKFDKRDPGAAAGPEGKAQELRRFIAGTTTFTVDEFGNTHYENGEPMIEAVNAGDVYNGILKLLANTSSQKKQIKKLRDFVKMNVAVDEATGEERIIDNKHSVATIKRLFELTGYNSKTNSFTTNQEMVNMFLKGFSSYSANYLFTQVDPNSGKTVTTYANTKDSSVVQVKSWNDAFSRVYEDLMRRQNSDTEYAALYKSKNQGISQFKEAVNESSKKKLQSDAVINNKARSISTLLKRDLGIAIHPNYIKYSILKSKEQDALNSDQLDFLETFGELEPITETMFVVSLTNTLSKGISPFGKDMYVVEGEDEDQVDEKDNTPYNILLKIAQNNSIFDETIGTISFTTSDNETRYAHTHPNFYYVNVSELNNPQVIEKIRKDVEKNTVHLLSNDDFIALLNNKAVKVNMAEGLKSSSINSSEQSNTNKKGTVYGDFVRRDNLAYLLAMYDISKKKDAKVSRSSEAEDFFYKTGHLIRTVESKKAGYFVDLPVLNAVVTKNGKTSLSDTALDILYNTVLYEIDRIARVNQEITTGKDENGKPVKEIMDYNQGALRGLKLYETANMLGDLAADIEKNAIDPNYVPDRDAILEQLNKYWMDQVDRFIEMMRKEGLINDKNQRVLAPQYLFKGFTGKNADVMNRKMYLIKNEFVHNVAQVFMNDFLNTSAINRLLHGDESKSFKLFVDQVKRAAGANAAGPSIESIVTKPEWGIDHEVVDVHHVTYEDTEFLKRSGEKGQQDDGQMYCTAKGLRYMLFGMGTLKQVQVDILNKIEQGLPVTKEEFFKAGGIQDMKAAFNPLKMVYFDGSTYLKCSVQMLSKEFTSYWSKSKGKWVAYPGKENLHNLREKMEKFEKKKKTITFAHPVSASKGMKQNVASDINTIADSNFNKLPAMYMRQQLENPSGKTTMTDPTQKLQQIFAEIPAKSKVFINGKEVTGKEAVDNYLDLIAKRAAVNYKLKRNGIFDIKDVFNEISMSYQTGQVTPKLAEFYDLCYENLMATGADSQTLEFFRTKDNQTVYNLNFPATLQKYTQLFLAYFSNGAFQAKVPGLTLTLISNAHHKIIKRLISVDENGQPKEWEV